MQRPSTRQSPAADRLAKDHMTWLKERGICSACGNDHGYGNVILHHCVGSSYKVRVGVERVQIGHAFVIALGQDCDDIVTRGTHKAFKERFGNYADIWAAQYQQSPVKFGELIVRGILLSGK